MSPAYHSNGAPLLRPCWAYAPTRCIPPARVPAISPPSRAVLRLPPSAAAACAPTTASAMASLLDGFALFESPRSNPPFPPSQRVGWTF